MKTHTVTSELIYCTLTLFKDITVSKHFDPISLKSRLIARGELVNSN